ncbi:uncharacterized protein LOC144352174, partial [Saccoglossus kowalevskii]
MEALWQLQSATDDVTSLLRFNDTLESHIRGLQALGKDESTYGELLVPMILRKLPNNICTQIARIHGNKAWNIVDLRKAITAEIHALQAGLTDVNNEGQTLGGQMSRLSITLNNSHAPTSGYRKQRHAVRQCLFCKGLHNPSDCTTITDPKKRLDIVKRDKLCYNCLANHLVSNCTSKFSCKHCGRKHHSSLHFNDRPARQTSSNMCVSTPASDRNTTQAQSNEHSANGLTTTRANDTRVHLSTSQFRQPAGPVILKTAVVPVTAKDGNIIHANVLFDEGATRSFATTRFAEKISMKPTHRETVNLSTLGHQDKYSRTLFKDTQYEEKAIVSYWDLETIGISADECKQNNVDKHIDYETYKTTHLRRDGGHYVAKLPWKQEHDELPVNFEVTLNRTRNMVQRLPSDILPVYDRLIREQESNDFIEKLPTCDKDEGHFLPHHPVAKQSSTTPIRIVYDCSCRKSAKSPSLNDCLDKGPPMLNDLTSILIKFRSNPVAITSDIEKAFLQVKLEPEERKFTKFLWLSDSGDTESEFDTYQFKSVLFGATPSPFILNAVVRAHLDTYNTSAIARDLQNNIYVDDVISGVNNTNEAIDYYTHANEMMTSGGFNLRSWSTNDNTLREIATSDNKHSEDVEVGILGMRWNTETDVLSYKHVDMPPLNQLLTKRDVWKGIASELHHLTDITINRSYFGGNSMDVNKQTYQLHSFADASTSAYGAVIYIRCMETGETGIVASKNRVSPTTEITLPRLELLACLIGTRLCKFVYNHLKPKLNIDSCTLWSDSQIALSWIASDKPQPVFIRNRTKEINEFNQSYRYVPTKQNPADLLTRGISTKELKYSRKWWNGPEFLANTADWPQITYNMHSNVTNTENTLLPISNIDGAVNNNIPDFDTNTTTSINNVNKPLTRSDKQSPLTSDYDTTCMHMGLGKLMDPANY